MRIGAWRAFILFCLLAALGGPAGVWAEEPKEPEAAARVNGVAISREAVERVETLLLDSKGQPAASPGGAAQRRALDRLIAEELLYQEAASRGIKVEKEKVREVIERVKDSMPTGEFSQLVVAHWAVKGEIVKTIERELMIRELLKVEVLDKAAVSEEEIKAIYDKEKELFRSGPEVRLQQIILAPAEGQAEAVGQKAEEIAARARLGEDFPGLAVAHSQGPFREKGGDLGWRSVKHLPASLRAAVEGAPEGAVVGPVRVQNGVVIAKVLKHRPSRILPLEEVRGHLAGKLREGKLLKLQNEFLKELRSRATVEILPPYAEGPNP